MAVLREAQRRAQERAYPERFTDGSDWLGLAEQILAAPATRRYTREEFAAATGIRVGPWAKITAAPGLLALREAYEELRRRAQFLTVDGEKRVEQRARELADMLRQERAVERARQIRAALEVLIQARKVPARRYPWSQLLRTLRMEVPAMQVLKAAQ